MKCILCGRLFPDELLEVKCRSKGKQYKRKFQRDVCQFCASPEAARRGAHRMEIHPCAMEGAFRLAGEIVRGGLDKYRREYRNAKRELLLGIRDGHEVETFLHYHKALQSTYFDSLSLGCVRQLTDMVRRDEDKGISSKERCASNLLNLWLEDAKH